MKKILILFALLFISATAKTQTVAVNDIPAPRSFTNISETPTPDTDSAPYALVAGGSKGIGYGIAEALAKRGYNLILVARHADTLHAVENKLENIYHIHVAVIVKDLADEHSAAEIAQWCTERNIKLKVLCNVAGLGGSNDYLTLPLDSLQYMVRLNVASCMGLTLKLLPLLEQNAPAYVLNVASMAGLAPIPSKNMYSATKSAIIFFSYSLRYQLKKKHISVSCLCPGPVFAKPEIVQVTKEKLGWFGMKMGLMPHKVGEVAIRKTLKKRMIIVPGTIAHTMSLVLRIMPRRVAAAIYNKVGG